MEKQGHSAGPLVITWQPHYSVGSSQLDDQHRQIISLVNRLFEAVACGEEQDALPTLTRRLAEYTQEHFRDEEQMMRQSRFPEYEEHRRIHQKLVEEAYDLQFRTLQHDPPRAREVLTFLKQWWINHIVGDDMAYAPFLRPETGEAAPAAPLIEAALPEAARSAAVRAS